MGSWAVLMRPRGLFSSGEQYCGGESSAASRAVCSASGAAVVGRSSGARSLCRSSGGGVGVGAQALLASLSSSPPLPRPRPPRSLSRPRARANMQRAVVLVGLLLVAVAALASASSAPCGVVFDGAHKGDIDLQRATDSIAAHWFDFEDSLERNRVLRYEWAVISEALVTPVIKGIDLES